MQERKGWKVGTHLMNENILERCRRQDKTFCVRKWKEKRRGNASGKEGGETWVLWRTTKYEKRKENGKRGNRGKGYGIVTGGREGKGNTSGKRTRRLKKKKS